MTADAAGAAAAKAASLACWRGPVEIAPLGGGITNHNFLVVCGGERFVARVGGDIPVHGILRFNEHAASRAAHAAGLSPEVVHAEPGALVLRYVEGRIFAEADVRKPENLARIVPLIHRCHREMPKYLRGAMPMFWVFQVNRGYGATLREDGHPLADELSRLLAINQELEAAVGPITVVFGHNDLLPGNFIDDGRRLWLVDWEYSGFNSALFDLGNLASNNELVPKQEEALLTAYFETPVGEDLRRRYRAMKCASLLREAMWSMVSETRSRLDFDYVAYTAKNLARFEQAYDGYRERFAG